MSPPGSSWNEKGTAPIPAESRPKGDTTGTLADCVRQGNNNRQPKTVKQTSLQREINLTVSPSSNGQAETVNETHEHIHFCLTVKLSRLQRFILKAAYSNKINQHQLPGPWENSWSQRPWRDLTNEEVAMLYYGIGRYAAPISEPIPAYKFLGVTIPEQKPGFSRQVVNEREVARPLKNKVCASISRAMKHLEERGLIERFMQKHVQKVFYASCNLTTQGFEVAQQLVSNQLVVRAKKRAWEVAT
jgi:hypothetical protein